MYDVGQRLGEVGEVRHVQKQRGVSEITVHRRRGERRAYKPSIPWLMDLKAGRGSQYTTLILTRKPLNFKDTDAQDS